LPTSQVAKDEFAFNNRAEPETIDPAMATGVPDNMIVTQIFEGLLTKTADWLEAGRGERNCRCSSNMR
jgi:ABC-type oligopeptide transport system substrate-binding subunit